MKSLKDRTRQLIIPLFEAVKSVGLALILVAVLQVTGLMQALSYWSQRVVLTTGLKNAETSISENPESFDYHFMIQNLQGQRLNFDQFKGKVVFLNLWATWCGPCRAEMPGIQKLYEMVDKSKVVFVMLSLDRDSDKKKVIDYMKSAGFTFNAYMPSGYLPEQLRVPSIPTTFVISPDGKVVRKEVGTMRYDTRKFQDFLIGLAR